ncbi:MAG: hypothetical protein AB7G75_10880 [Candidatus Binatia bacterium]
MTGRCEVQRGFFRLRPCGNGAISTCGSCGRSLCPEHARSSTAGDVGALFCPTCAFQGGDTSEDVEDPYWSHSYRQQYYDSHDYQPITADPADSYYDDQDLRGVEAGDDEDSGEDDESGNDPFGDS